MTNPKLNTPKTDTLKTALLDMFVLHKHISQLVNGRSLFLILDTESDIITHRDTHWQHFWERLCVNSQHELMARRVTKTRFFEACKKVEAAMKAHPLCANNTLQMPTKEMRIVLTPNPTHQLPKGKIEFFGKSFAWTTEDQTGFERAFQALANLEASDNIFPNGVEQEFVFMKMNEDCPGGKRMFVSMGKTTSHALLRLLAVGKIKTIPDFVTLIDDIDPEHKPDVRDDNWKEKTIQIAKTLNMPVCTPLDARS